MPYCRSSVKITDAHALILSVYPADGYRLLDVLASRDWRPRALGMVIAPNHPDFQTRVGPIADGIFAPSQWEPDERIPFPGTKRFIRAFRAAYGKMPSYHAGSACASCQILARAVDQVGKSDHDRIRDYISALDTVTVIGRFKVDPLENPSPRTSLS